MVKFKFILIFLMMAVAYSPIAYGEPDLEYGEYLSAQCTSCHLLSGKPSNIPTIIGWDEVNFIAVMKAYKTKELKNEVMQNIAFRLGDEELKSLAAFLATLKPKNSQN